MNYAPIARIIIRYVVGAVFGDSVAETILGDPDLMTYATLALSFAVGAATEFAYAQAVKHGWAK